ncbi:MAG: hypothetical protein ABIZ95_18530 [Pyrinomonadaceae bacterium]
MDSSSTYEMTKRDQLTATALRWGPWMSPLLLSVPVPLVILVLALVSGFNPAAVVSLFALAAVTFGVGLVIGLAFAVFLAVYRTSWLKNMRDKLAKDGVTAGELDWFLGELSTSERKALKEMDQQDALLADAYRETLASRITASRVTSSVKKELRLVDRRLNKISYMQGADTTALRSELDEDRTRLRQIESEAIERRVEAEMRLQQIEAAARRGQNLAHTDIALKRLNATRDQLPLALESAKIDREIHDEIEREAAQIRADDSTPLLAEPDSSQTPSS